MSTERHDSPENKQKHPWSDAVLPYVQGELSDAEQAEFEVFLKDSELCQLEIYETRKMIQSLQAVPAASCTRDLTPSIMAALAEENPSATENAPPIPFPVRSWALRIAACFALLLGGLLTATYLLTTRERTIHGAQHAPLAEKENAIAMGQQWLAKTQGANGAWTTEHGETPQEYSVGLTSLALLALSAHDEQQTPPLYAQSLQKGKAYLLSTQTANGQFGQTSHNALHHHALATLALLKFYTRDPSTELKTVLDKAIGYIVHSHDPSGGWSYTSATHTTKGGLVSVWPLAALQRAAELGWEQPRETRAHSYAWLDQTHREMARRSQQLSATELLCLIGGGSDLQDFRSVAEISQSAPLMLARLQQHIIETQETSGALAGSWTRSDTWGLIGERVYNTSMATLALHVPLTTSL